MTRLRPLFAATLLALSSAAAGHGIPLLTSWHLQLNGELQTPRRQVYDIDLFDIPADTIKGLKRQGKVVICYFSAGSYEDWRPDAADFPEAVKGNPLDGWPGEYWLDVRDPRVLAIMDKRLALARSKGCDGVDPDNVNGHSNPTGFALTAADLVTYNRALARAAHAEGLLIGLKNTQDLAEELAPYYDFALNESCYRYAECGQLKPFSRYGRPVFIAEYQPYDPELCKKALLAGYNLQFFKRALTGVGRACPME